MIKIEIEGKPLSYRCPLRNRHHSYNPLHKQKKLFQTLIQRQYNDIPLQGPIFLSFDFYMPIPKATSKVKRALMLADKTRHLKKPDCSNCIKFYEDCLKTIVISDDSQVVEMIARKYYSDHPRTVITINPL